MARVAGKSAGAVHMSTDCAHKSDGAVDEPATQGMW